MVSLIGEKIHTKKTPQGNFLAESSALDFFSTFFFCMEKIDYGVERWKLGCFENEKKKKLCDERFVLNKKKLCGYVVLRVVVWVKNLRMCLWARKKNVRNSSMTHTNVQQRCNSDVREHMSVRLATTCAPFLRLSISNWFFFFIDDRCHFLLLFKMIADIQTDCLSCEGFLSSFSLRWSRFFLYLQYLAQVQCKMLHGGKKFLKLILKILLSVFFFSISTSAFDFNSSCSSIHS